MKTIFAKATLCLILTCITSTSMAQSKQVAALFKSGANAVSKSAASGWEVVTGKVGNLAKKKLGGDSNVELIGNPQADKFYGAVDKLQALGHFQFIGVDGSVQEVKNLALRDISKGREIKSIHGSIIDKKPVVHVKGRGHTKDGAFVFDNRITTKVIDGDEITFVDRSEVATAKGKTVAYVNSSGNISITVEQNGLKSRKVIGPSRGGQFAGVEVSGDGNVILQMITPSGDLVTTSYKTIPTDTASDFFKGYNVLNIEAESFTTIAKAVGSSIPKIGRVVIAGPTKISVGQSVGNLNVLPGIRGNY